MDIKALNCPSCGGSVASDSTRGRYCGAMLATIACPHCFGLAFVGSKFCPHCGDTLAAVASEGTSILPCPRCGDFMQQRTLDGTMLTACDKCGGLWIDKAAFERICAGRESQAAVLGSIFGPNPKRTIEANPRYMPCPRCQQLMNRLNFAHASGVIIDICTPHGIWFDRDELRRIIEFIVAGGLDRAREVARERLESSVRNAENVTRTSDLSAMSGYSDQALLDACRFAGGLLRSLIR